jgi:hypothetical protein
MMAARGVVLLLVGTIFVDWIWLEGSYRGVVCTSLVGDVDSWQRGAGFGIGCGLVDSCRVEASSDVMVASMASLERGSTSVEYLEEDVERKVEVISKACAQGAFFGMYQGVGDGGDRGTRPSLILYTLY